MKKLNNYKNIYLYTSLVVISFLINFYVASKGVFPVDTFIHYDFGYRILLGDDPVKDYWIVHGFIIDYIQAVFFQIFGNNWYSYVIHSSLFNAVISLSSYSIFRNLKIKIYIAFLLSVFIAFLAYPVSGTPFLDLHSTFFSLLAIYILIIAIKKEKFFYWFYASILLCCAFFSKQVPAAYTIVGISLINIYFTIIKNEIKCFIYYVLGACFFFFLLLLFLLIKEISIQDFILQIILFPPTIGLDRYETFNLNFKNIFSDYKFIYLIFTPILLINLINLIKIKNYHKSENFYIFLILLTFFCSTLLHQIHTQNQVYIFSLVPILSGFLLYYKNFFKLNYSNFITYFILAFCFIITFKYHLRFNIDRKFHELNYVKIINAVDASIINSKLTGLKWISPYFENPQQEINIINSFISILKKDEQKKIVITEYNFISSLLNEKLHSPSRTFDGISYPSLDNKYFNKYKKFFKNNIINNKIKNIYVFYPGYEVTNDYLKHIVFNYLPNNCYEFKKLNIYVEKISIKKCKYLTK